MFIDENKIREKSKSLTGGFKGVVPRISNKKKKLSRFDYMRIFIGYTLTIAMIIGTIILFWNLISVGQNIAERKYTPKKTEYIEVIFKPNNK